MSPKLANAVLVGVTSLALATAFVLHPTPRIDVQIFWQTPEEGISAKASSYRSIPLDGAEHTLRVPLGGKEVIRLRIDPANDGDHFESVRIHGVNIRGTVEGVPRSLAVPPAWHCFNCSIKLADGVLVVHSEDEDPYLLSARIPLMRVDRLKFRISGEAR